MKLNKERIEKLCNYIRAGVTVKNSCLLVGINRTTFYEWIKKPNINNTIKKALSELEARNITIIQKEAQGEKDAKGKWEKRPNWYAAAWTLERRFKKDYAAKQTQELTTPKGKPIEIKNITSNMSPDEAMKIYLDTLKQIEKKTNDE